jgi:hypothetical protein
MNADRPNSNSTGQGGPRRRGFVLVAALYAAWLVFLLTLGLTQPRTERPAAPSSQPSPLAPKTAPQVAPQGS